ncbi:MAG TPA: ATP-dependent DNA helicase RecG, partial [Anaerovoracaceae bacterium]|nr:ATP-dependent DNA helicase RecG [Anaerovoracaceae bacterium]
METKNSVTLLKGIGPKYANALKKLDISTVEDFLFFYPNSYEDRRSCKRISDLAVGETALIRGKITHVSRVGYGYGKKRNIRLTVADESGSIEIVFFNSTYLARTLDAESKYEFYGKVTARVGHLQMVHPDYNLYHEDQNVGILPIYPLTKGITQNNMRKWVKESLNYLKEIEEHLPEKILIKHRLCDIKYAIENIHFPEDFRKSREAAFRLIFDELFIMQLGLLSIRRQIETDESNITFSPKIKTKDFISILPYKLTDAQSRVISEIEVDMEASKAMNRLVQGDVGSGKTVVAAAAAFKAIKCGYQVLMMAPTELLAQQHYDSLNETFERFQIKVGLLTGSMTRRQRNAVLGEISKGAIDFIIGTHALIQPDIEYANVGLVITDEQHRFGVNQRNLLSMKGENPDVLVMTATPIPRTLAVILYGDLDHSVIDEMPMGRKPILTKVVSNRRRNKAYEFLETQVKNGRQAYIVAPLIEDSEHIDVKSAVQVYE